MQARSEWTSAAGDDRPTLRRYLAICLASFVVWSVLDILISISIRISEGGSTGQNVPWKLLLSWDFEDAFVWALMTTATFAVSNRVPLQRRNWWKPLLIHGPAGIVVAFLGALLTPFLHLVIPWGRVQTDQPSYIGIVSVFVGNIPRYFMILAVCEGITYYRKYVDRELRSSHLETQLARAQLQALKMQLEPHFLFNVLNSIAALTRKDPASAEKMTVQLAELLRLTLETVEVQEVPLKRELEFLECYVRIQQTRFHDRLGIRFDIGPEVGSSAVPHLILQPLVENAIRHGIGPRTTPGTVEIRARGNDGRIVLEVLDDGRGLPSKGNITEGLGFKNTRARLRELYGDEYEFTCENRSPTGCRVRIGFPLRSAGDARAVGADSPGHDEETTSAWTQGSANR